jgi:F-type H+-transporting ATPase subunit delta
MQGASRHSLAAARDRIDAITADPAPDALRRLSGELFAVVHLLAGQARLRRLVSDPAVEGEDRSRLLIDLLGDRVSERAREVVDVLVRSAWSRPGDLVDATDELAAHVLFGAEEKDDALDEVEDELFRFGRILDREPRLRSALTDRSAPEPNRQALLDDLLADKVRPATATLVSEVVLHPRGRTIDRGLEEYGRLAAALRERLVARVRTVVPLTDDQQQRLADGLAAELGHRVHLNVEIDTELVGGITVRVGDELYDGSVAHRIALVRRLMAG